MMTTLHNMFDEKGVLRTPVNPFNYDLSVRVVPSNDHSQVTICCHGYGHNSELVDVVASYKMLPGHLIGFNFPDYNITADVDHTTCVHGTIDELLPLLYMIKFYACDLNIPVINLYGYSAGGGAVINALAVLNQYSYEDRIKSIGISKKHAKTMIAALERGQILLDCPLKSIDEIIAFRGNSPELALMTEHYNKNKLNTNDSLHLLHGLNLTVFLHFQQPDEILSNRDDRLFIDRLQNAHVGKIHIIISSDDGHLGYHKGLWNYYKKFRSS